MLYAKNELEDTVAFLSELRKESSISKSGKKCFIEIDLSEVIEFDYSSICVLVAIIKHLNVKNIRIRGNFPKDMNCKNNLIKSGLLNLMYDEKGKKFKKSDGADLLLLKSKQNKISHKDNQEISSLVKKINEHLTKRDAHLPVIRKIMLEIIANSIEWGYNVTNKTKTWIIGVKYEDKQVIVTLTDIGQGILKTIYRKKLNKIKETFNKDTEILRNAFNKKYGSTSKKINRNRGLPSIKKAHDDGRIKELKVLTNNIVIDFENKNNDIILEKQKFNGTLYRFLVQHKS